MNSKVEDTAAGTLALADASVGQRVQVQAMDVEDTLNQRLLAFGLVPGAEVRIVHVAPLGDPIAITFNAQKVMLRRADAVRVKVAPIGDAK